MHRIESNKSCKKREMSMKIVKNNLFIIIVWSIISFIPLCDANHQVTSHTVVANGQVPFSSVTPEMVSGFRLERTYAKKGIRGGVFQAELFGGASTHATEKHLALYFFPHNKTLLSVAEDGNSDNFDKKKDLLAQHFSIFTKNGSFRSEISIAPQQSTFGLGVYWRQCLVRDPFKGDSLWLSVSTALEHIRNRMNLHEKVLDTGGGPSESAGVPVVANMTEAFIQEQWLFGKIPQGVITKTRLADIEFKCGYDNYLPDEPSHMEIYVGCVIPTGNKYTGEFVFEPIVGRGKYAGLMAGGALGKNMWVNYKEDRKIAWELAVHGEYLFKNKQKRSLDLVDKPWSRYIQLYANEEQAEQAADLALIDRSRAINLFTPGINLLTQELIVHPNFLYDMNGAFVGTIDKMRVEAGYNVFFKGAERVKLAHSFDPVFAIKHADGIGTTNPIRTISGNKYLEQNVINSSEEIIIPVLLADFAQSIVQEADLDFLSAATPALLTHTVYMSVGTCMDGREHPYSANIGISYTFANNNAAINKWLLWAKSSISF